MILIMLMIIIAPICFRRGRVRSPEWGTDDYDYEQEHDYEREQDHDTGNARLLCS